MDDTDETSRVLKELILQSSQHGKEMTLAHRLTIIAVMFSAAINDYIVKGRLKTLTNAAENVHHNIGQMDVSKFAIAADRIQSLSREFVKAKLQQILPGNLNPEQAQAGIEAERMLALSQDDQAAINEFFNAVLPPGILEFLDKGHSGGDPISIFEKKRAASLSSQALAMAAVEKSKAFPIEALTDVVHGLARNATPQALKSIVESFTTATRPSDIGAMIERGALALVDVLNSLVGGKSIAGAMQKSEPLGEFKILAAQLLMSLEDAINDAAIMPDTRPLKKALGQYHRTEPA